MTTREAPRIDIRYLRKHGYLDPAKGWMEHGWTCNGKESGNIYIRAEAHALLLSYDTRARGEDWQPIELRVALERTPCHFGGSRPWLRCPSCDKRVGVLYLIGRYPLCRTCSDLTYESCLKSSSRYDTTLLRLNRVERKLKAEPTRGAWALLGDPPRPKGMHHRTYQRLIGEWRRLEEWLHFELLLRLDELARMRGG